MKTQVSILLSFMLAGMVVPDLFARDFRDAEWGMSIARVKATEEDLLPIVDNEPDTGPNPILGLKYIGTLGASPAMISYFFLEGKLVMGEYFIKSNIFQNSSGAYQQIKAMLYQKYGDPVSEVNKRSNDIFKISLGWEVKWRTERTAIVLSIKEPEGSIILVYTDRKFRDIPGKKSLSEAL